MGGEKNIIENENNLFKTRDLPLIALLAYKGKVEVKVEKENGNYYFFFEDQQSCEKIAQDFENVEISLNLSAYYNKFVEIKHKIFNLLSK